MNKKNFIDQKIDELIRYWTGWAIFFGAFYFIALSLLDYIATPENFLRFLKIRIFGAAIFITIFILNMKKIQRGYQLFLIYSGISSSALIIEYMILNFGGHTSGYYAGLFILVMVVVGVIPISLKHSLLISAIALSIYVVPISLFDKSINVSAFLVPLSFLISTFSVANALRYLSQKRLVSELGLQYDIEQQKKQLEIYSTQLEGLVEDRTKELRKSEQWHRSIIDNANDGIIILDSNGMIVNVNDKACEMHSCSRDLLVGAHISTLENTGKQDEMEERLGRLLRGESMVYESQHRRKDGPVVYLEVSAKAIIIEDQVFLQFLYRDITEKKKLQEHLLQSQKMESIGMLAGGIAHDFNNVLTAVLGHAEIIRRSDLDHKAAHSLNVIEEASRRAGRMISKLLGFARKSEYEIVPLNVNDIIYDTIKLLDRVIDKKIDLNIVLDHNLPLILGDLNQMEQIIMNLIVNARDAMPDGGRIVIKTLRREILKGMPDVPPYVPPGDYVLLSISDTGTGIPKDVKDKIFEPFFTTKERGKGTGLGLSMVYGAVKEHKGFISVQSAPGKGTVFTIYIPIPILNEASRVEKSQQPASVEGSETVLVIDDESAVLHIIQDALTNHGYKVFTVNDAGSGLSIFQKTWPEIALVITDIVMPNINGQELIARIKSINPSVKILAISGFSQYVAPKDEIGEINGFLQKPFESYYLLTVVRRILDTQAHDVIKN